MFSCVTSISCASVIWLVSKWMNDSDTSIRSNGPCTFLRTCTTEFVICLIDWRRRGVSCSNRVCIARIASIFSGKKVSLDGLLRMRAINEARVAENPASDCATIDTNVGSEAKRVNIAITIGMRSAEVSHVGAIRTASRSLWRCLLVSFSGRACCAVIERLSDSQNADEFTGFVCVSTVVRDGADIWNPRKINNHIIIQWEFSNFLS